MSSEGPGSLNYLYHIITVSSECLLAVLQCDINNLA